MERGGFGEVSVCFCELPAPLGPLLVTDRVATYGYCRRWSSQRR